MNFTFKREPKITAEPKKGRVEWVWHYCVTDQLAHMHRPAESGRYHVVDRIYASYQSSDITGWLTIQKNTEVIGSQYVHGQRNLDGPVFIPPETDVRVTLNPSYREIACDSVVNLFVIGHTDDVE